MDLYGFIWIYMDLYGYNHNYISNYNPQIINNPDKSSNNP